MAQARHLPLARVLALAKAAGIQSDGARPNKPLRTARERLGVEPDVVPGGHLAALSRPAELAAALARYL